MNPLSLLSLMPSWAKYALLGAIATALAAVGVALYVHQVREQGIAQGRAEVQARWDDAVKKQQADALAQAAANAQETQRRLAAQQEAQRAHDEELARIQADAAHAHAAADGMRHQLAAFTAAARRAASNPAAGHDSAATGAAIDLLADLYRRADERAGILSQALDASHAAGLQCERQYDSLTVKP